MSGTLIGELLIGQFGTDPTGASALGPCGWKPDWSCCAFPTGTPDTTAEAMVDSATELLWSLSGRQFGACQVVLRPCAARSYGDAWQFGMWSGGSWGWGYPFPAKIDGEWINLACGSCGNDCSCSVIERVILPGPITTVDEIRIDGTVLDPAAYRVDNRRVVVRQDGGSWPRCQHLDRPADQVGTWSITARFGRELPALGSLALAEVACEELKLCSGDKSCQLPANWTSITRSGVSITRTVSRVVARKTDLDSIPEEWLPFTRRFLRAYNPHHLQGPSSVWSPDISKPTRTF